MVRSKGKQREAQAKEEKYKDRNSAAKRMTSANE